MRWAEKGYAASTASLADLARADRSGAEAPNQLVCKYCRFCYLLLSSQEEDNFCDGVKISDLCADGDRKVDIDGIDVDDRDSGKSTKVRYHMEIIT